MGSEALNYIFTLSFRYLIKTHGDFMRIISTVLFLLFFSTNSFAQNNSQPNQARAAINSNGNQPDTANYATLNLYRPKNAVGGLVGYNIKLDDSTICKLKNGRKFSVRLYKEGIIKIWPGTEDTKISINVKFGEEYFVKFAMVSGLVGEHPELNLINPEQGRVEFEALQDKKAKKD
jgi:hypothetical protein